MKSDELEDLFKVLEKTHGSTLPVNFIGFQMEADDKAFWSRLTRRTGGKLQEIE